MNNNKIALILVVILIILIPVYFTYRDVYGTEGKRALHELMIENSLINILPDTIIINQKSIHRSNDALITTTYRSNMTNLEIVTYYNKELEGLGWQKTLEKDRYIWGKKENGKIIYYHKGRYDLSLEITDNDYYISLSWN